MKNKTKKILTILLIILLSPIFIYLLVDWKNLYVDMYNFRQLEKAKPILESLWENDKHFYSLKEFNEIYNINIKPIKNCYSISNDNWEYNYNFWFMLESYIYIYIYWKKSYIYPWYDMPYENTCFWQWICEDEPDWIDTPYSQAKCEFNSYCDGSSIIKFEETISKPCKD